MCPAGWLSTVNSRQVQWRFHCGIHWAPVVGSGSSPIGELGVGLSSSATPCSFYGSVESSDRLVSLFSRVVGAHRDWAPCSEYMTRDHEIHPAKNGPPEGPRVCAS